jgi:D-threo-aldose 1-dehydrogenase
MSEETTAQAHATNRLARRNLLGYEVPPIAIGCAPLASMPNTFGYDVPAELAHATVRAALESELNWLDTAAKYGDGESERRIGHVLREMGGLPPGSFLDTKIGATDDGRFDGASTRELIARSQESLGIERFDLVFLHDPEARPFEEIMAPDGPLEALRALRDEGVIRHLGVAGGPIDLMMRYVETGIFDAAITHNRYTLLNRSAEPLLSLCHEGGTPVLNAAPYGSGILAKGPDQFPRYAYRDIDDVTRERAGAFEAICGQYDVPLAAAALQFSLRDPRITGTIVGMSRPERIRQTIDYATIAIPDECWDELMAVPFDAEDL